MPTPTPNQLSDLFPDAKVEASELYSVREAMAVLREKRGSAGFEQANYLGEAGVLGHQFVTSSGKFYDRATVKARAERPAFDLSTLATVESLKPAPHAVILRMKPVTIDADAEWSGRRFLGTHTDLLNSPSADVRREANEAVRRYWPISPARRLDISRSITEQGFCPLVVTVGKWCLGGRDITGLQTVPTGEYGEGRTIFDVRDPGSWLDGLQDCWIDSGGGASAITWAR